MIAINFYSGRGAYDEFWQRMQPFLQEHGPAPLLTRPGEAVGYGVRGAADVIRMFSHQEMGFAIGNTAGLAHADFS